MTERQRDTAVERLLGDGLRRDARAAGPCLDAETIAAWAEGSLRGPARAAAEGHAASCLRCQSVLAAMARTESAAALGGDHGKRGVLHGIRWLVPIAGAAVAGALVLAIWPAARGSLPAPDAPVRSEAAKDVASSPATSAPIDASAAASDTRGARDLESARTAQGKTKDEFAAANERRQFQDKTAELKEREDAQGNRAAPPRREPAIGPKEPAAPALQKVAPPAAEGRPVNAIPPPPPPQPQATLTPQQVQALPGQQQLPQQQAQSQQQTEQQRAGQQASTPAPAAAAARADAVAESVRVVPLERSASAARFSGGAAGIATPADSTIFRIVNGREVQRSDDRGATWSTQTAVPAGRQLTAGACPTVAVCWIVGTGGTILRTLDGGRKWDRVAFAETGDLIQVSATDANTATVTSRDDRAFTTTDGGKTWRVGQSPIL